MCDDATEADAYRETARLNRREWSLGAGATVATLLTGCKPAPAGEGPTSKPEVATTDGDDSTVKRPDATGPAPQPTTSRMVTIATPHGAAEAFFVTPGEGRHPGVIIWPDIAGLRDAFKTMATRLAASGYAVLAVNQYYRSAKLPILAAFAEWRTDEGKAKIAPMREALSADGIASDGAAFAAWLDEQHEVDTGRKFGTSGYCMGGPFTVRTAAAVPDRVGAIASFHGGGLVSEDEDSPHKLFARMKAAALICIAHNDDERQPDAAPTLRAAAASANLPGEVEVYPARHGWCVIDSPVYDEPQAERAWSRMLATFEAHL